MSFSAYDVIVVGGGPSGSSCAAFCAASGLRVLVLERSTFPREKVCGDCLNPAAWPVLDRLGVSARVRALPHVALKTVSFVDVRGRSLDHSLPESARGEIAVRRSVFDQLLATRASECGATVRQGEPVEIVRRVEHDGSVTAAIEHRQPRAGEGSCQSARAWEWELGTRTQTFRARFLVAADGRNSTVARMLGLLPDAARDRVGLQTHLPLPQGSAGGVIMRFLSRGYCGLADVGGGVANLCLVSRPPDIAALKAWAIEKLRLSSDQPWRSIAPLRRAPISPAHDGLLLVGDVARVVEPFTGEGIYYALASGELAARHLLRGDIPGYAATHAALYRGRLWVNHLARFACLHPGVATALLRIARWSPGVLNLLTRKVISVPDASSGDLSPATTGAASG